MLPDDYVIPESDEWKLADSKVLKKADRIAADIGIRKIASAVGLGWVSQQEVDAVGLTQAVRLAMRRALAEISSGYDEIIIDGNYNFVADNPKSQAVIKADGSVPAVSAASIIAKVARDTWMAEQAAVKFPEYGFESHVGYGTKQHIEALRLYGPCGLHRFSYKPVQFANQAFCKVR